MPMDTAQAAARFPDPLQNTRYEFCKDAPRVSDADTKVIIKSPGGSEFRVHAHLLAFASEKFHTALSTLGILSNGTCTDVAVASSAQREMTCGYAISYSAIFGNCRDDFRAIPPWFGNLVVDLFVRWTYKRCQRNAQSDELMSEAQLATYFFDQDSNFYSEDDDDDDVELDEDDDPCVSLLGATGNHDDNYEKAPRYSYMYPEVLLGAWLLGCSIHAPEFQNTVMTLIYTHTDYVLSGRERCELALRALSAPSRVYFTNDMADLLAGFEIPQGSALEHFLVSRVAAYILYPGRDRHSLGDGEEGAEEEDNRISNALDVVGDVVAPLLCDVEASTLLAVTVLLAEELANIHYEVSDDIYVDERIYVS